MNKLLQDIFQLEDNGQFDKAFEAYSVIYSNDKSNYEIWKHFYFFLWTSIEDTPSSFHDEINLRHLLKLMFDEGKRLFVEKSDFNFIAGYTVSIFPYEYGDYEDLEKEGKQMLLRATKLEPENKIYKMVYLGSLPTPNHKEYNQAKIEATAKIIDCFSGDGSLNKYFKQVLGHQLKNI